MVLIRGITGIIDASGVGDGVVRGLLCGVVVLGTTIGVLVGRVVDVPRGDVVVCGESDVDVFGKGDVEVRAGVVVVPWEVTKDGSTYIGCV